MIFPEEFAVQVSKRGEEGRGAECFGGRRGSVHVASQHVVHIRVRLRLMKARLILGCKS